MVGEYEFDKASSAIAMFVSARGCRITLFDEF